MDDRLLKLLSIASEPLLTPPHPREAERLSSIGANGPELWEILLWKNGWYAFESALGRAYSHRIPLAELKCVSPKRRKEMAARLGESRAAREE
jgi:hypothetical protein